MVLDGLNELGVVWSGEYRLADAIIAISALLQGIQARRCILVLVGAKREGKKELMALARR